MLSYFTAAGHWNYLRYETIRAKSFHVLIVLEQSLLGLKRNETSKNATNHKEEPKARMKIDCIDFDKLRKYLAISIAPFSADGHPQELVHIHSGKLSSKEINVDSWKTIGKKLVQQFLSDLSDGFYKHLTAAALTMKKHKRSV